MKTLEELANELKASVKISKKAREEFYKRYYESFLENIWKDRDYYQDKFGERVDGGHGHSM